MTIKNALASVAVKDIKASIPWYTRLFGRLADSNPIPEVAEWRFPDGGWLQVYAGPERAGGCSFTLAVSNLEEEQHRLATVGINTGKQVKAAKVKTIMIKDPDGNSIAFAEPIDQQRAS